MTKKIVSEGSHPTGEDRKKGICCCQSKEKKEKVQIRGKKKVPEVIFGELEEGASVPKGIRGGRKGGAFVKKR